MVTPERKAKILGVLQRRQPDLTVVIEDITDPHNVSAIFRTCDAVGVYAVHLVYQNQKFPELNSTTSSSALKWMKIFRHNTIQECYEILRSEGYKIGATSLGKGAQDLYTIDLSEKTAIVVGNEHSGVSSLAAAEADYFFKIPMMGMVQSLNVSVAAAVILYEALRQRSLIGDYNISKISPEEIEICYAEWLNNTPFIGDILKNKKGNSK